jgi:hypothetical protein
MERVNDRGAFQQDREQEVKKHEQPYESTSEVDG